MHDVSSTDGFSRGFICSFNTNAPEISNEVMSKPTETVCVVQKIVLLLYIELCPLTFLKHSISLVIHLGKCFYEKAVLFLFVSV